jgi:molecular chaperone HscB
VQTKSLPNAVNSCWSCAANRPGDQIFCQSCHTVLPGFSGNYFELLGLVQQFAIDLDALEKNYVALINQLHPDRFAAKSGQEKLLSQGHAVDINEAYHTLADPVRRASYILRLNGIDFDMDRERTVFDQELLMEILQRREELAEAEDLPSVQTLAAHGKSACEATISQIQTAIDGKNWESAKSQLLRLQYLQKFVADAQGRQQQLLSAGF